MAWYRCTNGSSGGGKELVPEGKYLSLVASNACTVIDYNTAFIQFSCDPGVSNYLILPADKLPYSKITYGYTNQIYPNYPAQFKVCMIKDGAIPASTGVSSSWISYAQQTFDLANYVSTYSPDYIIVEFHGHSNMDLNSWIRYKFAN